MAKRKQPTDSPASGKKKASGKHGPRRTIAFSPEMYEQMQAIAERNGRPITWEFRRAIEAYLLREGE